MSQFTSHENPYVLLCHQWPPSYQQWSQLYHHYTSISIGYIHTPTASPHTHLTVPWVPLSWSAHPRGTVTVPFRNKVRPLWSEWCEHRLIMVHKAISPLDISTSSTAQETMGEVSCCDAWMAERIQRWTERWLELRFWSGCSGHLTHNCWM